MSVDHDGGDHSIVVGQVEAAAGPEDPRIPRTRRHPARSWTTRAPTAG